jgi:AcrR family transcriptional regulator
LIATVRQVDMAVKRKAGKPAAPRGGRAHGDVSRERILDAAREIASERDDDGTRIARVSERSGLPASSIYWHFDDKDPLLGARVLAPAPTRARL